MNEVPPFEVPTLIGEFRRLAAEAQEWRPNRIRAHLRVLDEIIASAEAHQAPADDLDEMRALYLTLARRLALGRGTRLWQSVAGRGPGYDSLPGSGTGSNPGQLLLLPRDEAAGAR